MDWSCCVYLVCCCPEAENSSVFYFFLNGANFKLDPLCPFRHDQVLAEALRLQDEMAAFQVDVEAEVAAVLERTQYSLDRKSKAKQPVDIDADLEFEDGKSSLPPPLIPQTQPQIILGEQ